MLNEKNGTPAMLEQTAEECLELGLSCLKLARMLRGENKVHGRTEGELKSKIAEELGTAILFGDGRGEGEGEGPVNEDHLLEVIGEKKARMMRRLHDEELENTVHEQFISQTC